MSMNRRVRGMIVVAALAIGTARVPLARGANPNDFSPSPGARWHDSFAASGRERVLVGDFNGDGRDDLLALADDRMLVLFAHPSAPRFDGPVDWSPHRIPAGAATAAGDVDGDGRDDIVYFTKASVSGDEADDAWVLFAGRNGFEPPLRLHAWFSPGAEIPAVADVDGDRRADLLSFVAGGNGAVWVGLSAGRQPVTDVSPWTEGFLGAGQVPLAADFNGDGRADVAAVVRDADAGTRGHVYVALAGERRFGAREQWNRHFCIGNELPFAGDTDGDGAADLLTFVRGQPIAENGPSDAAGDVYTALSEPAQGRAGRQFGPGTLRHPYFCVGREVPLVGDFDGDRRSDICTLVGPSVAASSPLHGDVRVAISTAGRPASWEVRLESVKTVRCSESSGDDPYFVIIGYRVRANAPDSAQVWMSNMRAGSWPENMPPGSVAAVPATAGVLTIPNAEAWTVSEIEAGRMPEMIGVVISCMESDSSGWDAVSGRADAAVRRLRDVIMLRTREHAVRPATRWADLKQWIASIAVVAPPQGSVSGGEVVDLTDDDDLLATQHFYYPAIDAGALTRLNLDAGIDFGTRTLTEQSWQQANRPLVVAGVDCLWHLQMRFRRTDLP